MYPLACSLTRSQAFLPSLWLNSCHSCDQHTHKSVHSLRLLVGTEAPIISPNVVDLSQFVSMGHHRGWGSWGTSTLNSTGAVTPWMLRRRQWVNVVSICLPMCGYSILVVLATSWSWFDTVYTKHLAVGRMCLRCCSSNKVIETAAANMCWCQSWCHMFLATPVKCNIEQLCSRDMHQQSCSSCCC